MKTYLFGLSLVVAVVANSATWIFLNQRTTELHAENGPMENFQALFLAMTALVFIAAAYRADVSARKIFLSSLVLFAGSILVLEVDFRQMNAPLLNKIMNGRIRDTLLGTLWLVLLLFALPHFAKVWSDFVGWLRTRAGALMVLAGGFWTTSALIDKSLVGEKSLFHEELMEVNATMLMLWAAVSSFRTPAVMKAGLGQDLRNQEVVDCRADSVESER